MNHEDELKRAHEVAIKLAQSLENEFSQVQDLCISIESNPDGLTQEQVEGVGLILSLAWGVRNGAGNFAFNNGFRKRYVLDVEAYTRQIREDGLPPLASIEDERIRKYCTISEKLCIEAERVIAAVDPKFITDRSVRKKKGEE